MNKTLQKWDAADYSQALSNSIYQNADERLLSKDGNKLKFNGFWRNGDKQNVCAWLDRATWHDAKTGEGGGCKEFAKIAFSMNLKEFMNKYGSIQKMGEALNITKSFVGSHSNEKNRAPSEYINSIWNQLQKRESLKTDYASQWLSEIRGIPNPRSYIGSGYINLTHDDVTFFAKKHQEFIRDRIDKGQVIAVPLRDVYSDKVQNFFLRIFSTIDKREKSRLVQNCGAWGDLKYGLRAFGFPYLIEEFPNIVLCEGMADYFAAEYLLDRSEKHLPLGASNADALVKWAQWFVEIKYKGCVHFIYQLDSSDDGEISSKEIGPKKALQAAQVLLSAGIKAKPFNWFKYLTQTTKDPKSVNDIADSLGNEQHRNEYGHEHLQFMFQSCLEENG